MRNLVNTLLSEDDTPAPIVRIPRQRRPLSEREFTRHIREEGRKQRTLHLQVARAMKASH